VGNAHFECGEATVEDGKSPESPAIREDELKETMSAAKKKRMTNEEFGERRKEQVARYSNATRLSPTLMGK
jgi:hypothetical protein